MLPFEFDVSPAVAELALNGRPTSAGVAATLVRLASQGWVVISEQDRGGYEVRLQPPTPSKAAPSDMLERELLRSLQEAMARRDGLPALRTWWPQWLSGLEQQSIEEGFLTSQAWRHLRRWRFVLPLARRLLPAAQAERWRAYAHRLQRYPIFTDPLPETRQEWDSVLAYAVALGQARPFLRHAREVCEYYERHFEGIVITFFTPRWYTYRRVENEGRFAFLTKGLADFVTNVHVSSVTLAEPVMVPPSSLSSGRQRDEALMQEQPR